MDRLPAEPAGQNPVRIRNGMFRPAPGYVLIRPDEEHVPPVNPFKRRFLEIYDLQRDAGFFCSGDDRTCIRFAEIDEREPGPEPVKQRAAILQEGAWQPRARHCGRNVMERIRGWFDILLNRDNRRLMIDVAELDAVALVLRISEFRDTGRNLGATLSADGHLGVEIAPVALRNSEPDLGVPRRSFPVP